MSTDASAKAQQEALMETAKYLVKFIEQGDELIISHGNGPQVGNLLIQQQAADSEKTPAMPLDTCVAMTEGSIGYWLQNAMGEVLKEKGIDKDVVSLVTKLLWMKMILHSKIQVNQSVHSTRKKKPKNK